MIAPDFKGCIATEMKVVVKAFVEKNHGHDLWTTLEPHINEADTLRKQLNSAQQFGCDPEQLKKFLDIYARNYQNAMCLNKYFTFGPGSGQIAHEFTWTDSF